MVEETCPTTLGFFQISNQKAANLQIKSALPLEQPFLLALGLPLRFGEGFDAMLREADFLARQ